MLDVGRVVARFFVAWGDLAIIMTQEDVGPAPQQLETGDVSERPSEPGNGIESISLAEATSFAEIEEQASQLLDYISKLSSLSGRACDAAVRQSEAAQLSEESRLSEVVNLRAELEDNAAKLDDQRRAFESPQNASQEEISEVGNRLQEKDQQLGEKENELKHLRAEITCLLNRLNEADTAVKQTEDGFQQRLEPLNLEIATLKSQLAQRDETIMARNNALKKVELNYRGTIADLEQRLRESETKLQSQETLLKEKDAVIQATASKEAEIGKLIKRLSTECQNLSAELQEKNRLLNEFDGKKAPAANADGAVWRRVIGRLQEEGL